MKLDSKQKRVVASGFLFALTCLTQILALTFSSVEIFGKYVQAASDYLQSRLDSIRITDFSPFYFDLHVILARSLNSYLNFLRSLQILAAAICVVLFYLITIRYFKNKIALIGAILLSFTSGFLVLTPIMIPEIWVLLFTLMALYFLVLFLNEESGIRAIVASGIFSGLSFLCRPTFLLFAPFFVLSIWLQKKKGSTRAIFTYSILVIFFVGLLFLRNYSYTDRITWMVMDPGGVFFEGNNPYSDSCGVNTPLVKDLEGQHFSEASYAQYLLKEFPSVIAGRKMTPEESNDYWKNKAINYIKDNPAAYFRLEASKAQSLFRTTELHDVRAAHLHEEQLKERHFPILPFGILSSLGLIGLLILRKKWKELLPFYGGFFIYSLAPLIYFVSSRYRFGLSPFVLFFACGALEWMHQRWKERKSLFIAALLFVPAFTLLIDAKVPADSHSYTWRSVVQALRLQTAAAGLRNQGKRKASAQKVAESIAASPFLSDGLMLANLPYGKNEPWQTAISMKKCSMDPAPEECIFDLGFLYLQSGHYREANELMETLTRKKTTFPRWYLGSPDPRYYLARIASEFEKNDALALEYYRKALRNNPGDFECLAGITVTLERTGKAKEADVYRKKLFRYVDEIDATYYLGKAYWYAGEYEKSASCFLQVQRWIPEERKNGIYAAAALGQSGKLKDAIAMYAKRMQQKQDPILLQREILNTFESYRDQHLESAEAHYMLGIILRQFGDFDAARKAQEQTLLLDPNLEAAKHELQLIDSVR